MPSNENIISGFDDSHDKNLRLVLDQVPAVSHCLSVYVMGSIDNYNSNFFQEKMQKVIEAGFINIVLRCSSLEYVSSTGIGVFATFFSKFKELGGNLVFTDLQPKVEELFQLLGFSHFFHIAGSMDEAIEFFTHKETVEAAVFPRSIECPICNVHLKAKHSGKFRCPSCKAIISVDEKGIVTI
ncbi:MAG: anti-sigma factor antagonist [Treponema sp.]|nr:anti-sigma factor antagonist [Treponema sp.]